MKLHLSGRFYELLWTILPKRKQTVDNCEISFVVLPIIVAGQDSKKMFVDAMCVTKKSARKKMIFVSKRACSTKNFRYTLYHEHIEGLFNLCSCREDVDDWRIPVRTALHSLGPDTHTMERIILDAKKNGQFPAHIVALVLECALVKKELPDENWKEYLADVAKNRI